MTTIKLYCTGPMARATVDGPLTHGMVGVPLDVEWDTAWVGLLKTLKFRCGDVIRTAIVDGDTMVTVPHECLIAGQWLAVGLDGWDADGTLRIPSSWASCGVVKPSVAQCDGPEGAPPTVDTVAQLQMLVGKAETAAGELAGAADAAARSASDADKSANAAKEALDKTAEIAVNTPYIGANYNWIIWDAEKASYVDSGVRAVGPQGPVGLQGPKGETGPQGQQGETGPAGSDAEVTSDNINKALGFTPADAEELNQIKDDLADLAPAGAAVGQLFRVAAVSEDGKYTMEPVYMPSGGGAVDDVTVDGVSIVQDGVANIPIGSSNDAGVFKTATAYGITVINKILRLYDTPLARIDSRFSNPNAILTKNFDYAVKAAMCDGKGASWTDVDRLAALLRIGCTVDDSGIVHWKAQEVVK